MDFFSKIKDAVHGWSEETRKFLAMLTMGIGLLMFFSLWVSSVSSRLVAIGPSAQTASVPVAEVLPSPVAFVPPQDNLGVENPAVMQPYAPDPASEQIAHNSSPPLPASVSQQAPTPVAGIAETFGGIRQLFRTTESPDTIEGRLRATGSWVWNAGMSIIYWTQNFLLWFGGTLYHRVSTLIAV